MQAEMFLVQIPSEPFYQCLYPLASAFVAAHSQYLGPLEAFSARQWGRLPY